MRKLSEVETDRLDSIDEPLDREQHSHVLKGANVWEAICFVTGQAWSQKPEGVCPALRQLTEMLDCGYACGAYGRDGGGYDDIMRELIPHLIDSAGDADLERRRREAIAEWLIREYVPLWLRQADLAIPVIGFAGVTPDTVKGVETAAEKIIADCQDDDSFDEYELRESVTRGRDLAVTHLGGLGEPHTATLVAAAAGVMAAQAMVGGAEVEETIDDALQQTDDLIVGLICRLAAMTPVSPTPDAKSVAMQRQQVPAEPAGTVLKADDAPSSSAAADDFAEIARHRAALKKEQS